MQKNPNGILRNMMRYRYVYAMILVVLAWYIVFCYLPMFGLVMSFQKFSFAKGFWGSDFIGLSNFQRLFSDKYFVQALKNTFIFSFLRILFQFPIPIIFAIALNEMRGKFYKGLVQNITYFPHFFNWVVYGGMTMTILALDRGVVNILIMKITGSQINFLGDDRYFRAVLLITDILKEMGWSSIVYIAAITMINPSLYESAVIDGANRFGCLLHILLPGIAPTVSMMFILFVGSVFSVGFDQVYNLASPVVYQTGDILSTYIVRTLKEVPNLGVQAAAGFVNSLICMAFLLVSSYIVKLSGQEGLY